MDELQRIQHAILARLSTDSRGSVLFSKIQQEIEADAKLTANALRGLLESRRVSLRRGSGPDTQMYLSLANDLSENLSVVLDTVRASGTGGVDQTQLMAKLRISKSDLVKSLHALIAQKYIQERRSFANRAKRIYLLYHLEPSAQVTGGTFYCGEELDVAFVDELRRRLVVFIAQQQQRQLQQAVGHLYPSNEHGNGANWEQHELHSVSLKDILRFMAREGLCEGSGDGASGAVPDETEEAGRSPTISFAAPPISSNCNIINSNHHIKYTANGNHDSAYSSDDAWTGSGVGRSICKNNGSSTAKTIIQTLAAPPSSENIQMKRIGTQDARLLVQSLVLDGVLEEVWENDTESDATRGGRYGDTQLGFSSDVVRCSNGMNSSSNGSADCFGEHQISAMSDKEAFLFGDVTSAALLSHDTRRVDCRDAVKGERVGDITLMQRYRLATGRNVLRHFTAQPKRHSSSSSCSVRNTLTSLSSRKHVHSYDRCANSEPDSGLSRVRQAGVGAVKRERNEDENEHDDFDMDYDCSTSRHERRGTRAHRYSCTDQINDNRPEWDDPHARQLVHLVREGSVWELAEVSQAAGRPDWAYTPALGLPCLGCPQLNSCSTLGLGIINSATCAYLSEWLS